MISQKLLISPILTLTSQDNGKHKMKIKRTVVINLPGVLTTTYKLSNKVQSQFSSNQYICKWVSFATASAHSVYAKSLILVFPWFYSSYSFKVLKLLSFLFFYHAEVNYGTYFKIENVESHIKIYFKYSLILLLSEIF